MNNTALPDMAWRMINASICAYQIHPPGWQVPSGLTALNIGTVDSPDKCNPYFYDIVPLYQDEVGFSEPDNPSEPDKEKYAPLFVSTGEDDINAALVGPMKDGNMVVSVRGTIPPNKDKADLFDWLDDWWQDFEIRKKHWFMEKPSPDCCPKVEAGFDDALMGNQEFGVLWDHLVTMIDQTEKEHGCTGVVVTGHSKGAAMTFLVASKIYQHYPQFRGKIQVYAFAAPVVGNRDFQTAYDALNIPTHRFQVKNDLVPFLALWVDENIFPAVRFPGFLNFWKRCLWKKLGKTVTRKTDGGYYAVGDTTYFPDPGSPNQNSDAHAALVAVADTIDKGDFGTVAHAHSAVHSYRPHFEPPKS